MKTHNLLNIHLFLSSLFLLVGLFGVTQNLNAQSCTTAAQCICSVGSCVASNGGNDFAYTGCQSNGETIIGGGMCYTTYTCSSRTIQGQTVTNAICSNNTCGCQTSGFCQGEPNTMAPPYTYNTAPYACGGSNDPGNTPPPPGPSDFSIQVSPITRSVTNGQTTSYAVTVNPIQSMGNAFVTLSVSGCPAGATCVFRGGNGVQMEDMTTPPASGTYLDVTAATVNPATYTLNIQGSYNGTTRQAPGTLIVSNPNTNNSLCLSISAPDTVTPGQQFQFSSRFRNTGTKTWSYPSPGVCHRLGSWNPHDVDTWGPWTARTDMGAGVTVAPNGEITFTRTLTAPSTPGNYAFQFAMLEEGVEWMIGPGSVCVKPGGVTVASQPLVNAAQCMAVSFTDTSGNPISSALTGQPFRALITMRNSGTTTWTPSGANNYHLTVSPWNNNPWNNARTPVTTNILPGAQTTFTLNLTAPNTAGTYAVAGQMLQEGVQWFNNICSGNNIDVSAPAPNSQCLAFDIVDGSGNILSSVTPGQSVFSRVRLLNNGNTTWIPFNGTPDAMSLAITPWLASPWNYSRGTFPSNVAPGAQVTITTPITAPNTPGTYAMTYQLYKENQGWIGQTCTKSGGVVVGSPLTVSITPSATSVVVGQQVSFTINASSGTGLDSVGLESLSSTGVPVNNLGENAVTGNSTTRVFSWTPSAVGTYYFGGYAWSTGRASLLRTSPPVVITVSNSVPPNASQCTSISLTDTSGNPITAVTTNQAFRALVNMRNTGTNTWTPSGANNYHLTTIPWSNNAWSNARTIIGTNVATNGQHTFTLNLTAPSTPGTYPLQTQMLQEGVSWFGEACNFSTVVGGGGVSVSAPTNNAQCVSVSAPTSVVAGSTFTGTITMRNTGTKPWTAAFTPPNGQGHKLGSASPHSNAVWGSNSVRMNIPNGTTIGQNQTHAFSTTFTAPGVAGTYPFTFQMLEEAVEWFGNLCAPSTNSGNITVTAAPITQYTLTVNKTIGGSVRSVLSNGNPDGLISCGSNCVRQYDQGSTVRLEAIPDTAQWRFAGWGGACSGTPVTSNCVITVNGNTSVTAQFRPRALQYQEF